MKLEDLKSEMRVRGVEPDVEVKILHVEQLGTDAVTVTYKQGSGAVGQQTLFRSHEAGLAEVKASLEFAFTADAHDFKLAVEALRIDLAHLFDPADVSRCRTRSGRSTRRCSRGSPSASCSPTIPAGTA